MMPTLNSARRSRQAWRRSRSPRERGIRWLTLIGSPVSESGMRHTAAASCWRSKRVARERAAPAKAGWAATSRTRSLPTQISRSSLRSRRKSWPARAGMGGSSGRRHRRGPLDQALLDGARLLRPAQAFHLAQEGGEPAYDAPALGEGNAKGGQRLLALDAMLDQMRGEAMQAEAHVHVELHPLGGAAQEGGGERVEPAMRLPAGGTDAH